MDYNGNKFCWFITGCSKGFGYILTLLLLKRGYCVTATTRCKKNLEDKIKEDIKDDRLIEDNLLIVEIDLAKECQVREGIQKSIDTFGRLDVVVNNSGFLKIAAVEEISDEEFREVFDSNFFSMLNVLRVSLPFLREYTKTNLYGGCRIYNISSIGGILNLSPGSSPYSSTKFAMEAVSESLYYEMKPHNVHVSCVKPGYFRTSIRESCQVSSNPNSIYSNVRDAENSRPNWTFNGDPEKAMNILIDLSIHDRNPPLHLFLGPETIELFNKKQLHLQTDLENYKHLTISTNFNQ
ncbi:hypothetical protein DICPUDRAFT_92460 [Dictyostelium purpureum]|uniref:Short-chain dehydrogenase/reductase SDR n=1 Tax=Dictyostelium purpureum TaxID=5786 RepID=F0ZSA8_DICPU|nr:uncharacterized protein DICPUDRAFT_92460 [Dictyostelium purpureum]EGC33184.1 hypothetical protein DICPUDRAFT_92460 [Dictyostelium purpureum]|eukprot:XP_003290304.1 hypothetical protein DICPUDRAFT_92460 [Dictyostelium purpureum]